MTQTLPHLKKFLLLYLIFFAQVVCAQNVSIKGTVTDDSGEPLPGVTILEKDTNNGTISDVNGEFTLNVSSSNSTLVISYIGMTSQSIELNGATNIEVTMKEDALSLQEVVVVGYGTQEKMNVTGSVATVKAEELVRVPSPNISDALVGKAPGLFSVQNQGVPGNDYTNLSIRGFGDPLVLVDGIQTSWTRLDPNEIESVTVLKDAAAAIYGARAGNGVILITTKRGGVGKPTISYSGSYTIQQPTTIPNFTSSAQYAELLREGEMNSGLPFTYSEEDIQKFRDGNDPDFVNENWYDATFRNWAPMQSHNVSVRGGTEKTRYFMTVGYLNQASIYESGDLSFNRYNVRSNIDVEITDRLTGTIDLSYRDETRLAPQTDLNNIWINLKTALPMYSPYLPDPSLGGAYSGFLERSPLAQTTRDLTGFDDNHNRFVTARLNLNYEIPGIAGLEANAALNFVTNNEFTKVQDRPFDVLSYDHSAEEYISWGTNGTNFLFERFDHYTQFYPMISLNYEKKFGDHSLKALALSEVITTKSNYLQARKNDLLSVDVPYLSAGSPDNQFNTGGAAQGARASYVGRINYSFMERYLLEGTFRYDASHQFPAHSRWGFFPSVSAGWRLGDESFIKDNVAWIDDLKIRASFSVAGNDNVNRNFAHFTGYYIPEARDSVYVFGDRVYRLISTTGLPNPDITWYEMTNYNVGIDASFFKGFLGIEFDYFYRLTENLFGKPLEDFPSTFGAILPELNINSNEDRGFELTIHHRNTVSSDFKYNVSFMGSYARQKYKYYSEAAYDDPDEQRIYQRTGRYTNRWIGYLSDGLFMSQEEIDSHPINQDEADNTTLRPGDIKYIDLNDDGVIDWRDQDEIGYGDFPDLMYGINLQLEYKNFSLTALFQGASMFNSMISDALRGPLQNLSNPFDFHYKYRWQPDPNNLDVNINPDARLPAIIGDGVGTTTNNNKASDFWLQDATYLRLKNVNLSYNIPSSLIERIGIQNASVYIAGSNLLTWSKLGIYKDSIDPEMTGYQKFYPPVKTIALGLNVSL